MKNLSSAAVMTATGLCVAMTQASFGALITNGSFEEAVLEAGVNATAPAGGSPGQLDSGFNPTTITGWTVDNDGPDDNGTDDIRHHSGLFYGGPTAQEGTQYVGFTSFGVGSGGTLSQSFSTSIGQSYSVSFYANNAFGNDIHELIASVDTTVATQLTAKPSTSPASQWQFFDFDFVATDTTSTLSFTSAILGNSANADILLDNVVVVPEPSSMALFGLGGLLLARRRRAKY